MDFNVIYRFQFNVYFISNGNKVDSFFNFEGSHTLLKKTQL